MTPTPQGLWGIFVIWDFLILDYLIREKFEVPSIGGLGNFFFTFANFFYFFICD
jgi:hypothetical protein